MSETQQNEAGTEGITVEVIEQIRFAGWGRRAAARVIDLLYTNLFILTSGFIFGIFLIMLDVIVGKDYSQQIQFIEFDLLLSALYGYLGMTVYTSVCEGFYGSTLGKMILGLVVLRDDFETCDFLPALIRGLLMIVDGLFFGIVAAIIMSGSSRNKRLGDRLGKTIVVYRNSVPDTWLRPTIFFILVFLIASLLTSFVMILPYVFSISW